jgi:hypothetical protein
MAKSKFGALKANVDATFKQEIISPLTGDVLRDKQGKASFIEVYSADSSIGRKFDTDSRAAQMRQARAGDIDPVDPLDTNIKKCAALTKSWFLVDPSTLEAIDVPCTPENALECYSDPGLNWLFVQPWLAANKTANFMQRPSKGSLSTDKPSGETAAS